MNHVYRNSLRAAGNTNHWLKFKLEGVVSNRDGIGATVRMKARIGGETFWQMRPIASQSSGLSLGTSAQGRWGRIGPGGRKSARAERRGRVRSPFSPTEEPARLPRVFPWPSPRCRLEPRRGSRTPASLITCQPARPTRRG